jgi:hypothetical protein
LVPSPSQGSADLDSRWRGTIGVDLGLQLGDLLAQRTIGRFESEHSLDPSEVEAVPEQSVDPLQPGDVLVAVAPGATVCPRGNDQPMIFVRPNRLGVNPSELGRDRDRVEGARRVGTGWHGDTSESALDNRRPTIYNI